MGILDKRPNPRFSRRGFLARMGLAAAASPFVPLLNASGQESTRPRRLLLVFTPHGTVHDRWKPAGGETDFQLSPILAPLAKHRGKIVVCGGLNMPSKGVGAPHTKGLPLLFTGSMLLDEPTFKRPDGAGGPTYGWNSGPSVDQHIVKQLQPKTLYPSIELGVRCRGSMPQSRMIYAGPRMPIAPETSPYALFDRLFTGAGGDQARAERKSALDVVRAELEGLRPRASLEDRAKLDAHLETVRELEKRLTVTAAMCKGTQAPMALQGTRLDPNAVDNSPWTFDRQSELVALAFACDVTRVASIQYSIGDIDGSAYRWIGVNEGHHDVSHKSDTDTVAKDNLTKIYTWHAERIAYLLDRLDAIPEGNGTVLDNTMVLWGSELAKGNAHTFDNAPFVVAGRAGGAIRTGRFLNMPRGTAHHRLLVSACHVMGLAGVTTFGNTDNGTGPLPGLLA